MGELFPNIIDNLKESLKDKGCKLTPQRRAILSTMINNEGKHLTVEELYDLVKDQCPEIGLATVYRTVQLLEQFGVVSKLELDDGCSRYELVHKDENHTHHHLICTKCGRVIEVKDDLLEDLESSIEKMYNFKIYNHSLKFYGLCEKCKKNNK
ncbi:Fur family transcriptional regulator [Haloimpatiens sp. FM7315]|uniref:Fur family transcriptional regulator n=1 Tax=Haloimpatiens sp. FM7315 TaxID=3298609 RepID=UPI0035A2CB1C